MKRYTVRLITEVEFEVNVSATSAREARLLAVQRLRLGEEDARWIVGDFKDSEAKVFNSEPL